jgi:uncharacterized protein DUF3592
MSVTYIVGYVALFCLGLGMLVRGLMTVSQSRTAWMARSVAGTAQVVTCTPVDRNDSTAMSTFKMSVRYADTRGHPYTADLPASQQFQPGDMVDIRFDPKNPKTVYVSEQFAGWDLPMALIAFGGGLMFVSFISLGY